MDIPGLSLVKVVVLVKRLFYDMMLELALTGITCVARAPQTDLLCNSFDPADAA